METTEKLTPTLHEAVKCWVLSKSYLNNDVIDANWHKGYEAECRLFNEFFKKFTSEESAIYKSFVKWLSETKIWKSDLVIAELFSIYSLKTK